MNNGSAPFGKSGTDSAGKLLQVASPSAWIFPGQGSQFLGMGLGLNASAARSTFAEAAYVLGWDVRDAVIIGPPERLAATEICQPAILTVSVAAARSLSMHNFFPGAVAGHSLGEFAALVASGALDFADALRVVAARGTAMARAGRRRPGGMAAVLGLPVDVVKELCDRVPGVLVPSNFNTPVQTVVSGEDHAIDLFAAAAREAGARRVVRLNTSIAAHSPLMDEAVEPVRHALESVVFTNTSVPFVSGVTGRRVDVAQISEMLARAVSEPVRWTDVVQEIRATGATEVVEVGPGSVLTGLVKHIDPEMKTAPAGSDADIATLMEDDRRQRVATR